MLSLSIGTRLSARLMDSLSTRYTQTGAAFTAITNAAVTRDGQVVIPAGSVLYGVVEQVDRPDGRLDRSAKLVLALERIEVDGYQYPLTATVVGASEKMESGLGDEKAKMGIGAGVGAVLGAVLGGKKGAVAGIILGGSGAVLATEGKKRRPRSRHDADATARPCPRSTHPRTTDGLTGFGLRSGPPGAPRRS